MHTFSPDSLVVVVAVVVVVVVAVVVVVVVVVVVISDVGDGAANVVVDLLVDGDDAGDDNARAIEFEIAPLIGPLQRERERERERERQSSL